MGDEIFSVYLTPADYSKLAYAKLDLPASPWKLLDAMDKVRLPEGDSLYLEITDYLGLDMRINSIPGQLRYRVTFSSQMRRMGADMTSEGLRALLSEVGQTYALLTALESRSYTPTTEDLTAFREELLAEQEAKSFPTLSQTI